VEAFAQGRPLGAPRLLAAGRPAQPHQPTRPRFAQPELRLDRPHRRPLRHGR
jgi:hypothetical protein